MATTVRTAALMSWLREHHAYAHPALIIAEDDSAGVHWRATSDVQAGAELLSVPHALTLSCHNALVDDAFPVFQQCRDRLRVEAIGFFYLMVQYVHRENSFWQSYLETLPQPEEEFTTPLFFERKEDIAWLEGSDVWHTATARTEVYKVYYRDGICVLKEAGIDVVPYTWHLFKWAVTMFTSRSFSSRALRPQNSKYWTTYRSSIDGKRQTVLLDMSRELAEDLDFPVLFPGMDASNHDHDAHVDWAFDPGRFSLTTTDGVQAHQQVFNNYGPKGNEELLMGYGFCIPENRFDGVMLSLKSPPAELYSNLRKAQPALFSAEDGNWTQEKAVFRLKKAKAQDDNPYSIFDELPEALVEVLLYILRHERRLQLRSISDPIHYLEQDDDGRRYPPHIARVLVQSLAPKLAKLQATNLSAEPRNQKQRHAAIYCRSQIDILEGLIVRFRTYTRSLIWHPKPHKPIPSGPALLRLENILDSLPNDAGGSQDLVAVFLKGIEASANTTDLTLLRQAGWEEDMWVLLLTFLHLRDTTPASPLTADSTITSRLAHLTWPLYIVEPPASAEELAHARSLLDIVQTAAEACPDSLWCSASWSAEVIAQVGGRMMLYDSFTVICPGGDGRDEARLCVYLQFASV